MTQPLPWVDRYTRLSLSRNDGRGHARKRADCLDVRGVHLFLWPPLMVRDSGGVLQVGRVRVPHKGIIHWWGNVHWDCWYVLLADAVRVLEYARERGATVEQAPEEFARGWEKGEALVLPGPEWEVRA